VLLLTDPVDAFWVRTALGFDGKPFQSVTQGAADLDKIKRPDDAETPEDKADAVTAAPLATRFKELLGDAVEDVRTSERLAESPVCLVAPDFGYDRQLEKVLARQEGGGALSKPILEINPHHPMIKALAEKVSAGDASAHLDDAAHLLLGLAKILDGEAPEDTVDFSTRLAALMTERFS